MTRAGREPAEDMKRRLAAASRRAGRTGPAPGASERSSSGHSGGATAGTFSGSILEEASRTKRPA